MQLRARAGWGGRTRGDILGGNPVIFIAGPSSHFPVLRQDKLGLRVCLYKIEHLCETSGRHCRPDDRR
jgi:hypothetical protein